MSSLLTKEEVYKIWFGKFCVKENVINEREMIFVTRAMDYANFDTYIPEPKSKEEIAINDIFEIKVFAFYRRCLTTDNQLIKRLREYEHYQVKLLQMKFFPIPSI
jgi:hypothetical protein